MEPLKQYLTLENRERLTVSGVTEIRSFDDRTVMLYTVLGSLSVFGRALRMEQLSTSAGEMCIEGEIQALRYGDRDCSAAPTLWGRLLR